MKLKPSYPRLRRDHPLANGLAGAWILSDGGGNVATDSSDWSRDGELENSPAWSPGRTGWSLKFEAATADRVRVPEVSGLFAGDFSISCEAFADGTGNRSLIGNGEVGQGVRIRLDANNRYDFRIGSSNLSFSGATVVPLKTWHQITVTRIGLSITAYLDGNQYGTVSNASDGSGPDLLIGDVSFGSAVWSGRISYAIAHYRGMPAEEVSELHADPFAMFRTRQRSYFAFAGGAPPDPPTAPRRRQKPQLIGCGVI